MHIRQQVREAVKTALTGIGLTVYTNRIQDFDDSELPVAVVLTEDEVSEAYSKAGGLERTIDITVVVIVDGLSATLDDDLDTWAETIEPLMVSVPPSRDMVLTGTALDLRPDDEGARWFGYLALEFKSTVFTD